MDVILDTHTFIWFINGEGLPDTIVRNIENVDNKCFISIASIWEIAIKTSLKKLTLNKGFDDIKEFLLSNDIEILPVTFEHIQQLIKLPHHHNDPFDRLIIAQTIAENVTVLSMDSKFASYPVKVQWG